jgi:hypothetical protein
VRAEKSGKIRKLFITKRGYARITLMCKAYQVHRLVAKCFVKGWDDSCEVNHKDANKLNNCYLNLEPSNRIANMQHAKKLGLMRKGGRHSGSKEVINIMTGQVFPTVREAAEKYKINPHYLSQKLTGVRKNRTMLRFLKNEQMKALLFGCSRSEILVYPSNWKTKKASINKNWLIQYRFYDPNFKGTNLWGKCIPIKGMNRYKTLVERQEITEALLNNETAILNEGWNPITKVFVTPRENNLIITIDPQTSFINALRLAEPRVETVEPVHRDMRSIINAVEKAAVKMYDQQNRCKYSSLPVFKVESRHLIYILEQCKKDNENLTDKRYNKYIAYLSMIFNTLKSLQSIGHNPLDNLNRKKTIKKKRLILTDKEAAQVDQYIFQKDYYFWRYMHIFYHSGSRNTEMMQVKKDNRVDLQRQEFIVLVKKGSQYEEQTRVISNQVLHLWQEAWTEATEGQYLFGHQFRPSDKKYYDRAAGQYWHQYVKTDLDIKKDWYALKHKRSDLLDTKLSSKHAQQAAGHKSAATTKIYTVGADERRREEIKNIDISLTG